VQAWAPLARGKVRDDLFLQELSKKYSKTTSQIALRWIIQHGCVPLPGTSNKEHMKENFEVLDFKLTENEMDRINKRAVQGPRKRITIESGMGFCDEFDLC
jgi:diketogulonate reductase-like aldo/keto reductase